jgi:hypothetical protein
MHCPVATFDVHDSSVSAVTVTSPGGFPIPGDTAVTVYITVTFCPVNDGSGMSEVMAVVVIISPTTCGLPVSEPVLVLYDRAPLPPPL